MHSTSLRTGCGIRSHSARTALLLFEKSFPCLAEARGLLPSFALTWVKHDPSPSNSLLHQAIGSSRNGRAGQLLRINIYKEDDYGGTDSDGLWR
jgi:hypothetical protein